MKKNVTIHDICRVENSTEFLTLGHMKATSISIILICSYFAARSQNVEFTSSKLPIVIINTNGGEIVDDPKIVVDMAIIHNGDGQVNNLTDPHNVYDGKAGIEIRGSSSQMFPKKQYGIELRAADGEDDNDTALLGLPKESDWILFAPYNDKTLMRDALSYRLGRAMGDYASRAKFCELVLNDEYMGVYVLLEKVKRGKDRVNINKLDVDENTGDDLTGGYILKLDKTTGGDEGGWFSAHPPENRSGSQDSYFQYEYPKGEDITTEQKAYIKGYVDQFENVLASDTYNDATNGWTKYADMNSFVDFFIANEISKNPDGYRLSTFMYKKKDSDGGKLFMGPIWDFNLGYGNVNYCTQGDPEGLVIDFNNICPDDGWLIPFWWQKLWNDKDFRAALTTKWTTLRADRFSNESILGYMDSVKTVMNDGPQQRNFQKWPVLGQYIWPNYQYNLTTYNGEVNWTRTWMEDRLAFLDKMFLSTVTGIGETVVPNVTVRAFPNPFDNELMFDYDIPSAGTTKIEVFDITGRNLSSVEETQFEGGHYSKRLSMTASPGLYVYRVTHNNGVAITGKLSKR
jgi:hypothetical protein